MKKEIREVKDNIVQVTIADERWYIRESTNKETGLPEYQFVPSVTWICSFYPKGVRFYQWLASKGWDEAEAIKQAAGDKGSKVHQAIIDLIDGKTVKIDAKYVNPTKSAEEELTLEEYECVLSFSDWFLKTKPEVVAREVVVFNDEYGYAGTTDLLCKINGEPWLIDFKTSQQVWPEHEIQVSGYKHAIADNPKLAILQIGYRRNREKNDGTRTMWKFTEVEDQFDLFLAARQIWAKETEGQTVFKKDYPLAISLLPVKEQPKKVGAVKKVTKK